MSSILALYFEKLCGLFNSMILLDHQNDYFDRNLKQWICVDNTYPRSHPLRTGIHCYYLLNRLIRERHYVQMMYKNQVILENKDMMC